MADIKKDEKKLCGDEHEVKGNPSGLGDKHPLHGQKVNCLLDSDHKGNHSGKASDGTTVNWQRVVILI